MSIYTSPLPFITYLFTKKIGRISLNLKFISFILLGLVLLYYPYQAQAQSFKTAFFDVELGSQWKVSGRPQNSAHALNATLVNATHHISMNILVGSARETPYKLLTDLQKSLRAQKAKVNGIQQNHDVLYFTFQLGSIPGFAISATNLKDSSCITVLGNKKVAMDFIHTFKSKDKKLFPVL